jgi:hypothetical protein
MLNIRPGLPELHGDGAASLVMPIKTSITCLAATTVLVLLWPCSLRAALFQKEIRSMCAREALRQAADRGLLGASVDLEIRGESKTRCTAWLQGKGSRTAHKPWKIEVSLENNSSERIFIKVLPLIEQAPSEEGELLGKAATVAIEDVFQRQRGPSKDVRFSIQARRTDDGYAVVVQHLSRNAVISYLLSKELKVKQVLVGH